jgi:hypothetical protein
MKIPLGIQAEKDPLPCEETLNGQQIQKNSSFFSSLAARIFFFLLLIGDVLWLCYALVLFVLSFSGALLSFSKIKLFVELRANAILTLKRSLVCGISLLVALFSPAFGIMIACTYFLMYDRGGIEEVVPSSLQNQFKEFLSKDH